MISDQRPAPEVWNSNKTKITISRGHGSLRSTSSFAKAIHMDLVGGQKSLTPTTIDNSKVSLANSTARNYNYNTWKWAWPDYTKKTVPSQIRYLLEHLETKFSKTPTRIHTDGGTEFSNAELQEILLSCDIEWHKSSSHATEKIM
ncbi:putative serine threonine protein kinase domain protein [Erysiphe necator]|uniref:Putative serine threonine protein kinase domain protein n=1 Tax=Uncinula necator TaxID=52586 RepID=A0A0B1P6M4_UNCNE|nr:putative serine threonine protein kinase domain protein [Erysiphe necator]